jgi:hypothetical protein
VIWAGKKWLLMELAAGAGSGWKKVGSNLTDEMLCRRAGKVE